MGRNGPLPKGEQTGDQRPMTTPAPPPKKGTILTDSKGRIGIATGDGRLIQSGQIERDFRYYQTRAAYYHRKTVTTTAQVYDPKEENVPRLEAPIVNLDNTVNLFPTQHRKPRIEATIDIEPMLKAIRQASFCSCYGLRHQPHAIYCRECGGRVRDDARLTTTDDEPPRQAGCEPASPPPHRGSLLLHLWTLARVAIRRRRRRKDVLIRWRGGKGR